MTSLLVPIPVPASFGEPTALELQMIGAHPTHLPCSHLARFTELLSLLHDNNTGCRTGSHKNNCAQQTTSSAGVCHV